MPFKIKKYGWKPDQPDHRDNFYKAPAKVIRNLPPAVDLRAQMPAVFDQGDLGSCTANAACGMVWYVAQKEGDPTPFEPSRLFEYYNTRLIEGTTREDSGASIRDSIKSLAKYGYCPEADWPYDISKFAKKPPANAYNDAKKHLIKQYHAIPQTPAQIKAVISTGLPVDFGFSVYESFESDAVAQTGIVPMPASYESMIGGHAVLLVGYDDTKSWYIVRNSWGASWGVAGYFYMPYTYVHSPKLASDFWTINSNK